ncbi:MAG: PAS domain S-box protein, partial [Chloroflexota bacterium]
MPAVLQTSLLRLIHPLVPLWNRLVDAPTRVLDPAQRRRTRLLNFLIVPVFASLFFLMIWGARSTSVAFLALDLLTMVIVYLFNRIGMYLVAATLLSALISASVFAMLLLRASSTSAPEIALMWIAPAVVIAYLLLPLRGLVVLLVANLISILLVPLITPISYGEILSPFYFTVVVSLLILISAVTRSYYAAQIAQQAHELSESEARFRSLLEASFETVIVYRDDLILDINASVETLLGYTPQEVIGRSLLDFIEPPYGSAFTASDQANNREPIQILLRHKNGRALRAEVRSKWHWYKGQSVRVVAVRDITELKNQEALTVEREKVSVLQKFIGNLSHDLRTPLSVINTSIYLINRLAQDPERQRHQIEVLHSQAAHMQRLLEDLISMSRLDKANTSDFSFQWINVNEPIKQAIQDHQNMALRKMQTLSIQLASDLPDILLDVSEFKLAIKHLILNGLSYTGEGGIVTVETYTDQKNVIVQVRDNGVGIQPDDIPHIFEHFYRADQARGD